MLYAYKTLMCYMLILIHYTGDALKCLKCVAVENDEVSPAEDDCAKGNAVEKMCDRPTDECYESAFYMSIPPNTGIPTSYAHPTDWA